MRDDYSRQIVVSEDKAIKQMILPGSEMQKFIWF